MTAALLPRAPFGAVARLAWRPAAPSMTALAGSFAGAVSSDLESLEHCIVQADGEDGVRVSLSNAVWVDAGQMIKERKKADNPREGWEDGTPPPHRDFKEGTVWCWA